MNVRFYFDPSCPFSWITSRWLLSVQSQADSLEIDWRPFALAIKNRELTKKAGESEHAVRHREALRVLRIMLAAERQHNKQLIDTYSSFGLQKHIMFEEYTDDVIGLVIKELGLPKGLIGEADAVKNDDLLQQYIDEAVSIVGPDIGVPTIVFTLEDGSQQGYFGPVLQSLPSKEDAVKIWDSLYGLATTKEFYELKRSRPNIAPDTPSTARC